MVLGQNLSPFMPLSADHFLSLIVLIYGSLLQSPNIFLSRSLSLPLAPYVFLSLSLFLSVHLSFYLLFILLRPFWLSHLPGTPFPRPKAVFLNCLRLSHEPVTNSISFERSLPSWQTE